MKSRVLSSSYVVDFPDNECDSDKIDTIIRLETDKILDSFKNEKLKDWEIRFSFRYNNVRQILISKSRFDTYTKDKQKEVIIHIPIPTKDIVNWGVNQEQHVYENPNHLDNLMKNFICLDVDFFQFMNSEDYILDCMRRAVKLYFTEGVLINSVKLKIIN